MQEGRGKMREFGRRARRLFWSIYGRHVWDTQNTRHSDHTILQTIHLLVALGARPGDSVLDVGCGTGNYVAALAAAGFRVAGLDYAPGMLERSRSKIDPAISQAVSLLAADLAAPLPFTEEGFDHAIAISVLQALPDPLMALGEIRRVLRPGGTLVILHVPAPSTQGQSLRRTIRQRMDMMTKKSIGRTAMVVLKTTAERMRLTRYWTPEELTEMLVAAGFQVASLDTGPPILVAATRPPARTEGEYASDI